MEGSRLNLVTWFRAIEALLKNNLATTSELMAVTGMANETNRLANGYRVPIDAAFQT